jgi:hypothetical protein
VHPYPAQGEYDEVDGGDINTDTTERWLFQGHCHQDKHNEKVAKEKNMNKKNVRNQMASYCERNEIMERSTHGDRDNRKYDGYYQDARSHRRAEDEKVMEEKNMNKKNMMIEGASNFEMNKVMERAHMLIVTIESTMATTRTHAIIDAQRTRR